MSNNNTTATQTTYIVEKKADNNKSKRIFVFAHNNKVVLHAYETQTKFNIFVHTNADMLTTNDSRFSVNPHYTDFLNKKRKAEAFSKIATVNATFEKTATAEEKQTARNNALNDFIKSLNDKCAQIVEEAKRKAEEEAQKQTEAQQTATDSAEATAEAQTEADSTEAKKQTAKRDSRQQKQTDKKKQTAKRG